jgi:DNA-binding transcriptional LysR family regulator
MFSALPLDSALLETFLAVVRLRSLSNASRHLFVSQSTISHRLAALESGLSVKLIDRSRGVREIALTAEGLELVAIAQRWEELVAEARSIASRKSLSLAIGAPPSVNHFVLPGVYRLLAARRAPRLRLRVVNAGSSELYEMVSTNHIDVAVVGYERPTRDLSLTPMLTEPMLLVTRNPHLGAHSGDVVNLDDLDPVDELRTDWGPGFDSWHQQRWSPHAAFIDIDPGSLGVELLENADYWAIVPRSMAATFELRGCVVRRLAPPPPDRTLFLARRRQLSTQLQQAMEIFTDCVAEAGSSPNAANPR